MLLCSETNSNIENTLNKAQVLRDKFVNSILKERQPSLVAYSTFPIAILHFLLHNDTANSYFVASLNKCRLSSYRRFYKITLSCNYNNMLIRKE